MMEKTITETLSLHPIKNAKKEVSSTVVGEQRERSGHRSHVLLSDFIYFIIGGQKESDQWPIWLDLG